MHDFIQLLEKNLKYRLLTLNENVYQNNYALKQGYSYYQSNILFIKAYYCFKKLYCIFLIF